jgi:hypothetical protein
MVRRKPLPACILVQRGRGCGRSGGGVLTSGGRVSERASGGADALEVLGAGDSGLSQAQIIQEQAAAIAELEDAAGRAEIWTSSSGS